MHLVASITLLRESLSGIFRCIRNTVSTQVDHCSYEKKNMIMRNGGIVTFLELHFTSTVSYMLKLHFSILKPFMYSAMKVETFRQTKK